jgi:glycosyltransferase involved in cell wall biosynthesis
MNQPIFSSMTIFMLSIFTDVKYVIDSHSGLFNKPQWKWSLPLMKYVYRNSLFSIVTNQTHKKLTESWGARIEVLGALSVGDEKVTPFDRPDEPCMVIIGSFAADEPAEEIIEACSSMPDVKFYMTGDLTNAPQELVNSAPENLVFTGYLKRSEYVGLVQAMDAAMILVTNDDVMQMGAYEAMSWAVPIITSDWAVLRENFFRGAVFVDNSPGDIIRAVHEVLDNLEEFRKEILALRKDRQKMWDEKIARINKYIEENI